MNLTTISLPDPEQLLTQLAEQLVPVITTNTALVGIHSGGVWIMERLLPFLSKQHTIEYGLLDIAFYRDDFAHRGLRAENKPSQITFDVEDKDIILIDDIFYTGRTTRAAMNELFDYGRPASISLAVLINRGGRELPIAPQFIGAEIPLQAHQNLQLSRDEQGSFSLALEENLEEKNGKKLNVQSSAH